ncbi:MAG: hypothetical protein ACHQQQ_12025 [Bacteroidota bacterium]
MLVHDILLLILSAVTRQRAGCGLMFGGYFSIMEMRNEASRLWGLPKRTGDYCCISRGRILFGRPHSVCGSFILIYKPGDNLSADRHCPVFLFNIMSLKDSD